MNNETNMTKTQVFNVIILDKSGSMEHIRRAAVEGFNEILAGIRKAQERYADTQEHYVTLLTFCDCERQYVFDRVPVAEARPLTMEDYQPCCCTPLYDAMGFTLTAMRNHVRRYIDAVVLATIITDGLENSSREYTCNTVRQLVEELKNEGWTFTFMGANQNSLEEAFSLSIRNARDFDYSHSGTMDGMEKECCARTNFFSRLDKFKRDVYSSIDLSADERRERYIAMADNAFDEEEGK